MTDCNGYGIYLGGNESILKLDSSDGFTALEYTKMLGAVVYELYLN